MRTLTDEIPAHKATISEGVQRLKALPQNVSDNSCSSKWSFPFTVLGSFNADKGESTARGRRGIYGNVIFSKKEHDLVIIHNGVS
jgi:hypothetical protein